MTIICGTDLSENAFQAVKASAGIAQRLRMPLKLVHVIDELGAELTVASDQNYLYDTRRKTLQVQAQEMANRFGIEAESIVVPGSSHEKLIEIARAANARLLVVSSLGAKKQHRWLLGSTAERTAQASPVPVLVVRDGASIEAWTRGERALRVMVGVEISSLSKAALKWAAGLREIGRCEFLVAQVAWPFGEHLRLGIPAPMPLDHLRPELLESLTRDLRAWAGELPGDGETSFVVRPGWGRVDSDLTSFAVESKADLLVVGTHQRAGTARLWQGSISRGVLHEATSNVACVPRGAAEDTEEISTFRRVLIPTDFSPLANRAIPVGCGMVAPGGVVHLLHVVTRKPNEDDPEPAARLRALFPARAIARGIAAEIEVVRGADAGIAIWQAAGRVGADAICMATHGRSSALGVMLGSQAMEVVRRARQPVVLVPPEREQA